MFCPECKGEYREGFSVCAACGVPLVAELPDLPEPRDVHLVRVFATGNAALVPVVRSLLDDAGIEYVAKGDQIQDLFALGRLFSSFNPVVGPVEFFVDEKDASVTSEILGRLEAPSEEPAEDERAD